MSAEDVELLRTNFAAQVDEGYEVFIPMVHPEFEMETLRGLAAEPQVYRGPEGVRSWWESFYEVMDDIVLEPGEYHDVGDGLVVVEFKLRARGQSSGLEVTQDACMLCHVRDNMLIRIEFFFTLDEALAAGREASR